MRIGMQASAHRGLHWQYSGSVVVLEQLISTQLVVAVDNDSESEEH